MLNADTLVAAEEARVQAPDANERSEDMPGGSCIWEIGSGVEGGSERPSALWSPRKTLI